jgi:thiamine transport system substrate-binding protein
VKRIRPAAAVCLALVAAACGSDGERPAAPTVRLVTHGAFAVSDGVLEAFTEQTGIEVEVLKGADAGAVVNQAVLTKDDPQGDVLYGIDTTFLTLGLDEGIFDPYESPALADVPDEFDIDPEHRVTPIDRGDVCLNYDKAFFDEPGAPPVPTSLADLTDPAYRDLLVVEDPATSSPGLAFLEATVTQFGDDGWEDYWTNLRANGVAIASDWEDAYYGQFSGGSTSEGDRPIVVSYASSPPAEVVYADPPVDTPPTGVIDASCVRQVEYAGVLAHAANPEGARQLIDFLLSDAFQADMPLNMFVFPVREGTALPDVFERFAAQPADVIELDPFTLGDERQDLVDRWTEIVLR